MGITNNAIQIKPYSLTELAQIYGVTNRTIKNWIVRHNEAIGEKTGRLDDRDISIVKKRIGIYHERTEVIMDYYKKVGKYYPVDGTGTVEEILGRIKKRVLAVVPVEG